MDSIIRKAKTLYDSEKCEFYEVSEHDGGICFMSLFGYAKGMLLFDNGYRYREGEEVDPEDIEDAAAVLMNR